MTNLAFDLALSTLLNQFSVPMFAMDRSKAGKEFNFVCMNRAMEAAWDRPAAEILGKSVYDLLPKSEAAIAHRRYNQCVMSRSDLRFRDQFSTAGLPMIWDTTLQHVVLKDGGDRLVGTSIQLTENPNQTTKNPALEDIQYFSSMADLQLRNLISTFEIFRDRDLFSIQNEQHIDKLTGMCRTVQRAVEDIKKVVRKTNNAAKSEELRAREMVKIPSGTATDHAGSDTIEALFSDVAEDLRRYS